jgi:hypothetical protein
MTSEEIKKIKERIKHKKKKQSKEREQNWI